MASRQRARGPKRERPPNQLADLGIFDIPDLDVDAMGEDDSDVDESVLESELEALLSGKAISKPSRPKKKVAPPLDIERMAAECMKDVDDDEEEDISDPDLLRELQGLSCESPAEDVPEIPPPEIPERTSVPSEKSSDDIVTVLEERLKLYKDAVAAAKAINDTSKTRRYTRAIQTLEKMLKSAQRGAAINPEDIPPLVSIPKAPTPSAKPQLPPPSSPISPEPAPSNVPIGNLLDMSSGDAEIHPPTAQLNDDGKIHDSQSLIMRRDQYKLAALQAKRAGDKDTAMQYLKIAKSFDPVIEAINKGEQVDLSSVPPPLSLHGGGLPPQEVTHSSSSVRPEHKKENEETQTSSAMEAAALKAASEPEDPSLFDAPPPPSSILEALEQRLEKYNITKAAAEAEGNSSKVRRLQRIIKSYEKAIKDYKLGKPVDFEELPTPPGFAPIPVPSQTNAPQKPPSKENIPAQKEQDGQNAAATNSVTPPKRPAPTAPTQKQERQKPKVQRTNTSTFDKQLEFLLERQKLFRQAALTSKQNGDIQQAKEYLRMSKGFDSMIEATKCGLPIDASSIPTPPQLETNDFVIVDVSECIDDGGNSAELLETLEKDLVQQIEICTRNKEHFLQLGDVSSASKFEKLCLESKKDLCVIRHLQKTGQSAPKFHYETRVFSMVTCHTDLGDQDLEVTVERGINLPGKPDDLDSYVRIDFPIPSETPQRAKTHTVRDTNNPIYQEEFKFEINRKSRAQLRQFKRQALKLEVWSKGGFLRSDSLLGVVSVKLVDLESKCTIHDCFDLMDGRKACGGKLEVKVRIRQPLLVKQVEEVREKWLVIGS